MDQNSKISQVGQYVKDTSGEQGVEVLRTCLDILHQPMPLESGQIFLKLERITSSSEDLGYVIMCINTLKNKKVTEVRKIKDPQFTLLTRQGRPSTQAVECEIRFSNKDLYDMEQEIGILTAIEEYLRHIEKSLDRYMWLLRDKISYLK